ncbi:MAG: DNA replication/repair protein RecF [Microthrixaceae bacterium]
MHVEHLWLKDFRSYESVDLQLTAGLCAVLGPNGVGKSNLLEAVAYLAMLESFRGAPSEALVRSGAPVAVVRGSIEADGREQLIEAELVPNGRNRVLVNRQRLTRSRDLLGALRTTVFSPDDLPLIKGGPGLRRVFLDHLLVSLDVRNDALRSEFERAVRQRNALLKQTKGRLDEAAALTLEVWNSKLVESGEELARRRSDLVSRLEPLVVTAYGDVAGENQPITMRYEAHWRDVGLAQALAGVRADELRRGVTLVGPHRDDLAVQLNDLPSRTHSSQGEQRSLALALRLAGHRLVTESVGTAPVLLLDDVFSELDPLRSAALLRSLPSGQTLLSSAAGLPEGVHVDQVLSVAPGQVVEVSREDR